MEGRDRLMMYGVYGLAIAWPVMELALLSVQSAARGDPAREERARRQASGVKNVGRAVVFLYAAPVLLWLGAHAPAGDPAAVGETGARLMRGVPAFFALSAFVSAVMSLRHAVLGVSALRALPPAVAPDREG